MQGLLFILNVVIFCVTIIPISWQLYEDQAGKFDWKHSFIGRPIFADFFDHTTLVVATKEQVLTAINADSGQLIWRHVLRENGISFLQLLGATVVTVSETPNVWFVRGWDIHTGILLWEWTADRDTPFASWSRWRIRDHKLIHSWVRNVDYEWVEFREYNLREGNATGAVMRVKRTFSGDAKKCVQALNFYACLHDGLLQFVNLENKMVTKSKVEVSDLSVRIEEIRTSFEPIVRLSSGEVYVLADGVARHVYTAKHSNVMVVMNTQRRIIGVEVLHEGTLVIGSDRMDGLGQVEGILAMYGDGRVFGIGRDDAIWTVEMGVGVLWVREESLAHIKEVQFVELPLSEMEISIENEFRISMDAFSMFKHRLSTQIAQLGNWIAGHGKHQPDELVRDDFGLHKIVVIVTRAGKLFGVDTTNGDIVWRVMLEEVAERQISVYVQRSAKYAPLQPRLLLISHDTDGAHGNVYVIDPITGRTLERIQIKSRVKQTMMLDVQEPDTKLKPVIILSHNGQVQTIPEMTKKLLTTVHTFMFVKDRRSNSLEGWRLQPGTGSEKVWNVSMEHIVAVATRPSSERVHSLGRVLPDRSVYYKYVNPNLICIATLDDDVLTVYLIDGVIGLVLYSVSHKRVRGPIQLVHSENWIVYSYFNERFRRTEVVAAELFEGFVQSNATVFSSLAVSLVPHVQTQAYIVPGYIRALAVTQSERGITNKFLLLGMSNGAVAELPWIIMQPRSFEACGPEEACVPYMPELTLPFEAYINYNQTLEHIKGIRVAPARLESTTHVLVYGLDMFYTRVAPAKTFDVLKEDFDHRMIVVVLISLCTVVLLVRHLAAKKSLRQLWK